MCAQLLLQFYMTRSATLQAFSVLSVDMHVTLQMDFTWIIFTFFAL